MLLSAFIHKASATLETIYPGPEARSLVIRLCCERLGVKSYTHITEPGYVIDPKSLESLEGDLGRLLSSEPIQYILGYEQFYGRNFNVSPSVLIPRPETEQMVDWAIKHLDSRSRVLDLCTGSGCIAWSIALECKCSEVVAVDISSEAISVANNQFESEYKPKFLIEDILDKKFAEKLLVDIGSSQGFDFIISNPPYIKNSEKFMMRDNVLKFEPGLALFVSDEDPLVFYRAIAAQSKKLLRLGAKGGILEINEQLGAQTLEIFQQAGYKDSSIMRDYFGKERFLIFK